MQFDIKPVVTKAYAFCALTLAISITISTALTSLCALLLLLIFVFSGDYREKFRYFFKPYVWPAILILTLGAVSLLYVPSDISAANEWVGKLYKLVLIWILAYICSKNDRLPRKIILLFFCGVVLNIIVTVVNFLFFEPGRAIVFSVGNYPSAQSHFVTAFVFAIGGFWFAVTALHQKKFSWSQLGLSGLAISSIIVGLAFNQSRTGYVLVFFILLYAMYAGFKWRGLSASLIIIPLVFVMVYFASPTFEARVDRAADEFIGYDSSKQDDSSVGIRLANIHSSLGVFAHDPKRFLFGCGLGGFEYCIKHYAMVDDVLVDRSYEDPHNQYVFFMMQSGLPGLIVFLLWLLLAAKSSLVIDKQSKHNVRVLLIAFAIGCIFNSWVVDFGPGYIFCLLLPVWLSGKCFSTERHEVTEDALL